MDEEALGNATENAEQPEQQTGSTAGTDQSTTQQQQPHQGHVPRAVIDRIGEITRKRREAEEQVRQRDARIAELERQLAGSETSQEGSTNTNPSVSQRALEEMAERIAERRMSERTFRERTASIEAKGRTAFPDFADKMNQFQLVGGIPAPLFDVVSRFDNAHQMLYALANDIDLAASVVSLDPTQMAIEMARLSGQVEQRLTKSAVTSLPPPIEPIGSRSPGQKSEDQMTDAEWCEWRDRTAPRMN